MLRTSYSRCFFALRFTGTMHYLPHFHHHQMRYSQALSQNSRSGRSISRNVTIHMTYLSGKNEFWMFKTAFHYHHFCRATWRLKATSYYKILFSWQTTRRKPNQQRDECSYLNKWLYLVNLLKERRIGLYLFIDTALRWASVSRRLEWGGSGRLIWCFLEFHCRPILWVWRKITAMIHVSLQSGLTRAPVRSMSWKQRHLKTKWNGSKHWKIYWNTWNNLLTVSCNMGGY